MVHALDENYGIRERIWMCHYNVKQGAGWDRSAMALFFKDALLGASIGPAQKMSRKSVKSKLEPPNPSLKLGTWKFSPAFRSGHCFFNEIKLPEAIQIDAEALSGI
jgi:hypothetical protein